MTALPPDLAHLADGRRRTVPTCGKCGEQGHRATERAFHPAAGAPVVPFEPLATERARTETTTTPSGRTRAKTLGMAWPKVAERRALALTIYPDDVDRPKTRGDCASMPRPCPFVSCSHHLYLDVDPNTGGLKLNFPDLDVDQMTETCSLDVADRSPLTLEETGALANVTRERVRQIEERALRRLRKHLPDGPHAGPPSRELAGVEDRLGWR